MFKNYMTVAIRNLFKKKGFSAINIFGLAIGLAACLLILFYVYHETGYDKYNTKADRIFRIDGDLQFGGNNFIIAQTPDPLGPALKKDFPQVEQYVRFRDHGSVLVKKGNQNIEEKNVILADSTLFSVFTLPMIEGNPTTALTRPKSIVIAESTAKKYFNSVNVVGQTLTINDKDDYQITGVIKDIPTQSHFHFDIIMSMNGELNSYEIGQWVSNNFNTYILLRDGADANRVSAQLNDYVMKHVAPFLQHWNLTPEQFKQQGNYLHYSLFPLTKIHLYSNRVGELEPNGSIQYIYIFSLTALFILLIACVNFMNLSTAHSANRAKEVGVRKVLGSMRKNLIVQFLTESVLVSFIALLIGLMLAVLMLPFFNQLSGKNLEANLFLKPWLIPAMVLIMIIVGVIAGSYPAFYLSSFQPVRVLKGKVAKGFKSSALRSVLVVFQFSISIILIIGTLVIYKQLNYIRNKDVGYDRSHVLIIKNTDPIGNQVSVFKDEVKKIKGVENITMTGFLPTSSWRSDSPLFPEAVPDTKKAVSIQMWQVDEDYIPTLGMQIIKGRNFSNDYPTDSSGVILNEAAVKLFGFKDPLNTPVYSLSGMQSLDMDKYHIIGVVKNFNFNSLRDAVTPLCFFLHKENASAAIRIRTSDIPKVISAIEAKYKSLAPGQPFQYSFMDDDFNKIYYNEQRMGNISMIASGLAIFVACLGLLGLITFAAEQRSKEIGIRKVLGANGGNIISMLSKDFLKLVFIAALIAIPIGWWAMNTWLQGFAYRTEIGWWIFALAATLSACIAFITISYQSIKAASRKPVTSLRSE